MIERTKRKAHHAAACALLLCLGLAGTPFAQTLTSGDPGANVNVVGPTPDPDDIPDLGLKQQNEPACVFRPGVADCILCAFNDYRTVDVPEIAEAWQGIAMSCDAGVTWTSRVAPGHALHPSPINVAFAADPRLVALPGMALFNFIGGNRDLDTGVLALQHWFEVNREDADFYEPALDTTIVDIGTSGRFIDKPDILALVDKKNQQGTITLSMPMENPALGTLSRVLPTGDLFIAYAVLTGGNSIKVLVKHSGDWGQTWPNQTVKLSEDQNLVSGISMTAIDDTILAIWRRDGDINDFDSIMFAYSTNRGKKWTKGAVLADICSFDQITAATPTEVTFRTNDFPWAANDGKNFYVFYSDRNYDGMGDCTAGRPRIVMKHSTSVTNIDQSAVIAIDDSDDGDPMTTEDAAGSFQFMPAAFGANGKIQIAWYDTRREGILGGPDEVADYFDSGLSAIVNRRLDVYTARVISEADGNNVQIAPAVRVSQFRIGARVEDAGGGMQTAGSVAIEGEASFGNAKMYVSGTRSFIGDYIAVAGQEFRFDADGKVESNSSPIIDPLTDTADFFIAWTSNRDVRGNIFDPTTLENTVPYSPPENTAGTGQNNGGPLPSIDDDQAAETMLAETKPPDDTEKTSRSTEGLEDPFDPMPDVCVPATPQDRTRNANIYGSRIRDRIRLFAPSPTRPLTNLQRALPMALTNANDAPRSFRLRITNQPDDAPLLGRASFRQLPAVPPFDGPDLPAPTVTEDLTVPPRSSLARTVFLVSNLPDATTGVETFDRACVDANPSTYYQGACPVLASITLGGQGSAGELQQPNFQSSACEGSGPDCTVDVLQAELHNPELLNPELINPELINPELINPELINPELINPELINPELINPELINLGFANPELINPELINPELINPELINPELINPELINPELINSTIGDGVTWTDYTFAVKATGNVTTAFDADATLSGPAADEVDSQLIAWTLYITPTARNCDYLPQFERRVLATVNNPDDVLDVASIDAPFEGDISAVGVPGQIIFFTYRVFGTPEELDNVFVNGFTAASQAANCSQTDRPPGNTDPYFCQLTLAEERELILLDSSPPTFGGLMDGDVIPVPAIEADRSGGACVDLTGSGIVTAEDEGVPVPVMCTDSLGANICTATEPGQSIPVVTLANPTPAPIICTAVDGAGNVATINLFVDVRDTAAPQFTSFPASPVEVDADAMTGTATVNLEAGITVADVDGVDPSPVLSCVAETGQISGEPLPAGSTTIDCTVTDASGNFAVQSYIVQVNDVTAPTFDNLPLPDVTAEATDPGGAIVTYSLPTASDAADPNPTVVCAPASGSQFPLGTTTVSCTATDSAGNSSNASFDVRVGYAGGVGITPTKLNVAAGSSNPLTWAWQDSAGNNVDSSGDMQMLEILDCDSGGVVLSLAGDPGSSGFRFKMDYSWQFNWQADDGAGNPLPKDRYCAVVTSSSTGQQLTSPPIRVR